MSTTLPARAAALRARLGRLHDMSSNVAEAADLEGLRSQLARKSEKMLPPADQRRMLIQAGIAVEEPLTSVAARKKASAMLDRFVKAPKSTTLKKGQGWSSLLDEIEAGARDLQASVNATWKAQRTQMFGGETPGAIEAKLAKTRPNQEALKVYQGLYAQFRSLFDTLPTDQATIAKARSYGPRLEEAGKAFNFEVSADVKAFLEAVQSVGGAPMRLLTDEVLAWLREQDNVDGYRVRSSDRL